MSVHVNSFLPRRALRYKLNIWRFTDAFNRAFIAQRRSLHNDGRSRLSAFWTPTGILNNEEIGQEDSHSMLIRGGFVRQAHSGLYHFLPLGLRIQEKLERLLDKHMVQLGASKLSLSTLSSEDLWTRSGRLKGKNPDLFHVQDRKGAKYLLSPTHEEEITTLVGDVVQSYKDLPLRLYQISRKYRDEPRPRQGLLRTREFLMKDLYTFDHLEQQALDTYESVRKAYSSFFDELKIPYLVAEADSGSIGGNLSHEYHFPTSKGEDNIISCTSCTYVANEEIGTISEAAAPSDGEKKINRISFQIPSNGKFTPECVGVPENLKSDVQSWFGISSDRSTLYQAILPLKQENADGSCFRDVRINPYNLKHYFKDLNLGVEDPLKLFTEYVVGGAEGSEKYRVSNRIPSVERVFDYRMSQSTIDEYNFFTYKLMTNSLPLDPGFTGIDLVRVESSDKCPLCKQGTLRIQKAVELGHTFFLGTRYSEPLQTKVAGPATTPTMDESTGKAVWTREVTTTEQSQSALTAIQMGCHGIGVSRMIAAVADSLADEKGLNWPRVMAPFEAVVISMPPFKDIAIQVLDILGCDETKTVLQTPAQKERSRIDVVLDDRIKPIMWKLKDADLIGYPIIVVVGKAWKTKKKVEVQCRRLDSLKENVPLENLHSFVTSLLAQL